MHVMGGSNVVDLNLAQSTYVHSATPLDVKAKG